MSRKKIAVLFGGRSGEHEVSIRSAASVINALDQAKYEVIPVAITKEGRWLPPAKSVALLPPEARQATSTATAVTVSHEPGSASGVDVVFPVLHGTFGEDGTVQGFFELADVAYVGAGVLGSACGMDKDIMKRLFREAGLPTVEHIALLRGDRHKRVDELEKRFGYPLFVKPANLGSSVGITKAHNREELTQALDRAAQYDRKLVVERAVDGREIECSVLGNDDPQASLPGEIVPAHEFYDYEAKYSSEDSKALIPAPLTAEQTASVQRLAVAAFQAVECCGLARVDCFLENDTGKILLNEINTMPGFTSISMYPKMWEASGLPYSQLIDRLIELSLERQAEKKQTRYEF